MPALWSLAHVRASARRKSFRRDAENSGRDDRARLWWCPIKAMKNREVLNRNCVVATRRGEQRNEIRPSGLEGGVEPKLHPYPYPNHRKRRIGHQYHREDLKIRKPGFLARAF